MYWGRRANMLVILLLISQISCDWVEIAQNNYRKQPPLRATQSVNSRYEEKTQDNRLYKNQTATEKQWNKAIIDRVTNVGNVKRVQDPSVKTPSVKTRPKENGFHEASDKVGSEHTQVSIYKPLQEDQSTRMEEIHREIMPKLSNGETVKSTYVINNSNVKSTVKPSSQNPTQHRKVVKEKPHNVANFEQLSDIGLNKFPLSNNLREKYNMFSTTRYEDFHNIRNNDEDSLEEDTWNDYKFPNASITHAPTYQDTRLDKIHIESDDENIRDIGLSTSSKDKSVSSIDLNTNTPEKTKNKILKTEYGEEKIDNTEQISIVPKAETLSGMWKLMKVVTATIYKNTQRTFNSKIKYLEQLKTTILTSIEEQFDNVWPDDIEHRSSRKRRASSAQARGHVEFPSSESTLMTISFLTFAVFLIKLVLQVIHTYKNKTMMVTPAVFAAVGRAANAVRSHTTHD